MSFFDRFQTLWATDGTAAPPTDAQAAQGFSYLGQIPPSVELFNSLLQERDWKISWIYQQISSVIGIDGSAPSETGTAQAGATLINWFAPVVTPTFRGTATVLGSLEIGSQTAVSTPFVNFHTIGTNQDYDGRIIASGGTSGAIGQADFTIVGKTLTVPALASQSDVSTKAATTAFVDGAYKAVPAVLAQAQNASNFNVPAGVRRLRFQLRGAGGGGGAGGGNNASTVSAGGGGGGGAYVDVIIAVTPGNNVNWVVGAGGAGGVNGGASGANGGDTVLYVSGVEAARARGGMGGGNAPSASFGNGGNGGVGTVTAGIGYVQYIGAGGSSGIFMGNAVAMGGIGGASHGYPPLFGVGPNIAGISGSPGSGVGGSGGTGTSNGGAGGAGEVCYEY